MSCKKRLLVSLLVTVGIFAFGCGNQQMEKKDVSGLSTAAENSSERSAKALEREGENTQDASAEGGEKRAQKSVVPEDGIYTAEFETDSGMFHANESCEGKGTLTVEDGKATIHVSLVSKNIVNLYVGVSEDAQKDGAELLQPTEDHVKYEDGFEEDVYGFDIPVPVMDEEFSVAILGKKGKWYDHKVSVTNPQPK